MTRVRPPPRPHRMPSPPNPAPAVPSRSLATVVAWCIWLAWIAFALTVATGHPGQHGAGAVYFVTAIAGAPLICALRAIETGLMRRFILAGAVAAYAWSAAA